MYSYVSDTGSMNSQNAMLQAAERQAKRRWVGLVVALLSLQFVAGVVTVYLALSDPTVAVIPNYYQAGLDWDIKRRNLDTFVNLGWEIDLVIQPVEADVNQRLLSINLTKSGQPVEQQRVSASVYHHARGAQVYAIRCVEVQPGQYGSVIPLTQAGLWQMDIIIEGEYGVAESRFTVDVAQDQATHFSTNSVSKPKE